MRSVFQVGMSLALCCCIGFHWVFLQSFAWTRMMVKYSMQESLSTALRKTFDGSHPCSICKLVTEGKKKEEDTSKRSGSRYKGFEPGILCQPAFSEDIPLVPASFATPPAWTPRPTGPPFPRPKSA